MFVSPDISQYLGSFRKRVLPEVAAAAVINAAILFSRPTPTDKNDGSPRILPKAFSNYAFTLETLVGRDCTKPDFRTAITERLKRGLQPISVPQIADCLRGENNMLYDGNYFAVTLDQGQRSNLAARSLIEELDREYKVFIPISFFVLTHFGDPVRPIDQIRDDRPSFYAPGQTYLTKGEIKDLIKWHKNGNPKNTVYVDSNTTSGVDLIRSSDADILAELSKSQERLKALYKEAGVPKKYSVLSYPDGGVSERILNIMRLYFPDIDLAFSIGDSSKPQTPSEKLSLLRTKVN